MADRRQDVNAADAEVLVFERDQVERHGPLHRPAKSAAITAALGLSPARYYQILDRLSHDPAAVEAWPGLPRSIDIRRHSGLRATLHATFPTRSRSAPR